MNREEIKEMVYKFLDKEGCGDLWYHEESIVEFINGLMNPIEKEQNLEND